MGVLLHIILPIIKAIGEVFLDFPALLMRNPRNANFDGPHLGNLGLD